VHSAVTGEIQGPIQPSPTMYISRVCTFFGLNRGLSNINSRIQIKTAHCVEIMLSLIKIAGLLPS